MENDVFEFYITITQTCSITLNAYILENCYYSLDGGTWTKYNVGDSIGTSATGQCAFKATRIYTNHKNHLTVKNSSEENVPYSIGGHIMSLCGSTSLESHVRSMENNSFSYMFYQTGLTGFEDDFYVDATTLSAHCYEGMFKECTALSNLGTSFTLPATTLKDYCYSQMFSGCTSLTTHIALPAGTLVKCCYQCMFLGCTNLITYIESTSHTLWWTCPSISTATPTLPTGSTFMMFPYIVGTDKYGSDPVPGESYYYY